MREMGNIMDQAINSAGKVRPIHRATHSKDTPVVILDEREFLHAALGGFYRQYENIRDGRSDFYGAERSENGFEIHINGALGEYALSKWSNTHWGVGKLRGDDVGNWQVRTRSKDWYELIVHPDDPDDRAFVLITGRNTRYRLVGWIWGHEAKQDEFWKDPAKGRPAYFVPHNRLYPIDTLPGHDLRKCSND